MHRVPDRSTPGRTGAARRRLLVGGALGALVAAGGAAAQTQSPHRPARVSARTARAPSPPTPTAPLTVTVDTRRAGRILPADFLGLSLETPALSSPQLTSPRLIRLLSSLGRGLLRFAGDSVDHTQWLAPGNDPLPWMFAAVTPENLHRLARLTSATGWRVLLGLDLGHPDPTSMVDEVRTASSVLGGALAGVEIGNEPDLFTWALPFIFRSLGAKPLRPRRWGLSEYLSETDALQRALIRGHARAPLYGPDLAGPAWLSGYGAHPPPGLSVLTEHLYPTNRCVGNGGTAQHGPTLASLLSRAQARHELELIGAGERAAHAVRRPLRMDETNSVACAGQPGTSDTFGAALWALDYALLAGSHGVVGMNFHGGLGSCRHSGTIYSMWYSPLCQSPGHGLVVRPEYYSLLVLRALEGSAFVPVHYDTPQNVSAYGLLAADGTLRVVIDDMDMAPTAKRAASARGAAARPASAPLAVRVALRLDRAYRSASMLPFSAPRISSKSRVTFGGASVRGNGSFGVPRPVAVTGSSGRFTVTLRPGSAALITIKR